jgi:predicted DNA-binding transcriptional regulator YafY
MKVIIDYTNWRGERRERVITPVSMYFNSNEWHPEKQWLLLSIDDEDQTLKDFAMKDIHSWRPA